MSAKAGTSDSDGKPVPSKLPINTNQRYADSDDDISPVKPIPIAQKVITGSLPGATITATTKLKGGYSGSDDDDNRPNIKVPQKKPPKPEPPSDSTSSNDEPKKIVIPKKKSLSRKRSSLNARRTPRASKGGSDSNEDDVFPIKTGSVTNTSPIVQKGFYGDGDDDEELEERPKAVVPVKSATKRKSQQKAKDDDSY